jgi:hypothetical protein
MITLTLPVAQVHSDREVYRACLMPWLQMMRRDYNVDHYVWRAEAQENGNLHYHVIVDRYVPKEMITKSWNQMLDNLGYRHAYYLTSGSLCPPTTDVMAIRERIKDKKTGEWKDVDPVDYLVSYITDIPITEPVPPGTVVDPGAPRKMIGHIHNKDGSVTTYNTRAITGRVWGMADALRSVKEPKAMATVAIIEALETAVDQGKARKVDLDHATLYFGKVSTIIGRADPGMWSCIKQYYIHIYGHLYPDHLPAEHLRRWPQMDIVDLWMDLDAYGYYHAPSHAELQDQYLADNPQDDRLVLGQRNGSLQYIGNAGYGYRARRARIKRERLGITGLQDRWVFKGSSSWH